MNSEQAKLQKRRWLDAQKANRAPDIYRRLTSARKTLAAVEQRLKVDQVNAIGKSAELLRWESRRNLRRLATAMGQLQEGRYSLSHADAYQRVLGDIARADNLYTDAVLWMRLLHESPFFLPPFSE